MFVWWFPHFLVYLIDMSIWCVKCLCEGWVRLQYIWPEMIRGRLVYRCFAHTVGAKTRVWVGAKTRTTKPAADRSHPYLIPI